MVMIAVSEGVILNFYCFFILSCSIACMFHKHTHYSFLNKSLLFWKNGPPFHGVGLIATLGSNTLLGPTLSLQKKDKEKSLQGLVQAQGREASLGCSRRVFPGGTHGGWHEGTRSSSLEQCGLWGIVGNSACQKLGRKWEWPCVICCA